MTSGFLLGGVFRIRPIHRHLRPPCGGRALVSCEPLEDRRLFTVGAGYTETVIASGLSLPTALAVSNDSETPTMLMAGRQGSIRRLKGGVQANLGSLRGLDTSGSLGLLGLGIARDFETRQLIYVNYTVASPQPHQRISQFSLSGSGIVLSSEVVLLELPAWEDAAPQRVGGAIQVNYDGTLLVGVGDGDREGNAADLNSPFGKILRLRTDGSVPANNPYGSAEGWKQYVWASGLRDPAKFHLTLGGGVYVTDSGDEYEEINFGPSGSDFGAPATEGPAAPPPPSRGPIVSFPHRSDDPDVLTALHLGGGVVYNPPSQAFPGAYASDFFFADRDRNAIRILDVQRQSAPDAVTTFATNIPAPVDMGLTAKGELICLARGSSGNDGRLIRFSATGGPAIVTQPKAQTVVSGGTVVFEVEADGFGKLNYQWLRNGQPITGATQSSHAIAVTELADSGSVFSVSLVNEFGSAMSDGALLTVNPPPSTGGGNGGDGGGDGGGSGGDGGSGNGDGNGGGGNGGGGGGFPNTPTNPLGSIDFLPVVGKVSAVQAVGGTAAKVAVKVYNLSLNVAYGNLKIRLGLSADDASSPDDVVIHDTTAGFRLRSGTSRVFKLKFDWPTSVNGAFHLTATVDPDNAFLETNEANNSASAGSVVQVAPPFVDLRTQVSGTTAVPKAGRPANAVVTLLNDGNSEALASGSIQLWAASIGVPLEDVSASGVQLVTRPVKLKLAAGRSQRVKVKYVVPPELAGGTYQLLASTELADAVSGTPLVETNLANNLSAADKTVSVV